MNDPTTPDSICVEVVYADPQRQILRKVEIAANSSVTAAILASAIGDELPAGFQPAGIGIFGRLVTPATLLRDGDRVELYRPLLADPKDSRRKRARSRPPQL
jgi:hypothetical protein